MYTHTHTHTHVDINSCLSLSWLKAGSSGENSRLVSEALILLKSRRTFCHIPGGAGAIRWQMQATVRSTSNSYISPWWTDMCIWTFCRISGAYCDNSISSSGRQVAVMITAFHCFVGHYTPGTCDTWRYIPSCIELTYLKWSVVIQTCAVELR
jgi:hypothetical protein